MNSALIVGHVLTFLVALHFSTVDGQDTTCCPTESCCSNTCDAPSPLNITLDELVASQPIYVNLLPAIPLFAGLDSMCFTYFSLPDGTYLLNINYVYSSGINFTEEYIKEQEDLGVFGVGSAECNAQFTIFDYLETSSNCSLYLGYLCFRYGDCSLACDNDIPVFGMSYNATAISQDCLDSAIDLISDNGLDSQDYVILPYNNPTGCVTEIDCSINATQT